ncbi:starch-binding protein [Anaerocolumna xylanovorans]|uniref:Starch-binding module 26 n=1 Tax=Anaerocolumna xylanovorans DSM 12503 TaxID=1121345 RepID=A0A1M7XX34_9FIRM|nr:starch-binding protein [Anaerocolumna xylanovorans]SHO43375.1 Starch-binding module 26 [Anaerocolumna xylanovorans DSM 12503]
MKNLWKKVMVVLLAAIVITSGSGLQAQAAGNKVTIHVKDGAEWGSMNVYNWGDAGETAGVWPGTAMEEEGDGWYTYTFDATVNLNLVFSAKSGTPQSGNVNDVSKDGKEYWIVVGGEAADNDMGVSGTEAVLYTEPEEGWPALAAAEAAADKSTEKSTAAASDDAVKDVPKTGESFSVLPIVLMAGAVVVYGIASVHSKKSRA